MTIDVHAHVTVAPTSQLHRGSRAGVDQTVLLSTRVHPEAADSPEQVRAEYSRLTTVIGGGATSTKAFETAMSELRPALGRHGPGGRERHGRGWSPISIVTPRGNLTSGACGAACA
jgi:hypothetical protein